MKYKNHDIIIKARIEVEDYIDSYEIRELFDIIENALFQSDSRDVHYISEVLRLPRLAVSAAKQDIREYRHERLKIISVSQGSIIFESAVAAAALYVIKKVIADPILKAYKETHINNELTYLFRNIINEKTIFIADKIREVSRKRGYELSVRETIKSPDSPRIIYIEKALTKRSKKKRRILTLGEELDKNSK